MGSILALKRKKRCRFLPAIRAICDCLRSYLYTNCEISWCMDASPLLNRPKSVEYDKIESCEKRNPDLHSELFEFSGFVFNFICKRIENIRVQIAYWRHRAPTCTICLLLTRLLHGWRTRCERVLYRAGKIFGCRLGGRCWWWTAVDCCCGRRCHWCHRTQIANQTLVVIYCGQVFGHKNLKVLQVFGQHKRISTNSWCIAILDLYKIVVRSGNVVGYCIHVT